MPDTVFRSHAVLANDEGLKIPPTPDARVPTIRHTIAVSALERLRGLHSFGNHCSEPRLRRVLDAVYDRLTSVQQMSAEEEGPAEAVVQVSQPFTAKRGQYLAYIYYYTKIHGRPPAESDLQRFFRVTPPVVHQMIKTLDARGLIERQPGAARSIRLRLTRAQLPDLE
jgi:repressor LexA